MTTEQKIDLLVSGMESMKSELLGINSRLLTIENDMSIVKSDLRDIKNNVRRLMIMVPVDNADFKAAPVLA